jgi:hypothetical protein
MWDILCPVLIVHLAEMQQLAQHPFFWHDDLDRAAVGGR